MNFLLLRLFFSLFLFLLSYSLILLCSWRLAPFIIPLSWGICSWILDKSGYPGFPLLLLRMEGMAGWTGFFFASSRETHSMYQAAS